MNPEVAATQIDNLKIGIPVFFLHYHCSSLPQVMESKYLGFKRIGHYGVKTYPKQAASLNRKICACNAGCHPEF